MHNQQYQCTALRSPFCSLLLLKRFLCSSPLEDWSLEEQHHCSPPCVGEHRVWSCVLMLSGEALSATSANHPLWWAASATAEVVLQGSLPMGKWERCEGPSFPCPAQMSKSPSRVANISPHYLSKSDVCNLN